MHDFHSNRHNIINSLKQQGGWLTVYLILLAIVAWLCTEVWEKEAFSFDKSLLLWIHQFATPSLDRTFLFITALGNPEIVITIFVSAIVWLGMKKRYSDGVRFFIICSGGVLINSVMKLFFAKPRPELWPRLIAEHSFSFPSGHAVGSMVIYGFITYLLGKELDKYRVLIYAVGTMIIVLVGFSRLYLGVHYPTDIIAGYGVGLLWSIACWQLKLEGSNEADG